MTYSQKLRDPRWQKKRLHILERDHWKCQACHSTTKNLQVHHLYYIKQDPWEYPDEAYQTLCEGCHESRQRIIDEGVNLIRVSVGRIPTYRLRLIMLALLEVVDDEAGRHFSDDELENPDPCDRPVKSLSQDKGKSLIARMREAAGVQKGNGK